MNKKQLLLSILLALSLNVILAAEQFHPASEVTSGTFGTGDYVFPNNLFINNDLTISGTISGTDLNISWTNLTNYPSSCPSGQFVQGIGDALICASDSDTTYTAGNGLILTGNQFNLSSGVAGDGLTYTNGVLNIGAGTGVTVAADTISIGQSVGVTDSPTFAGLTLTGLNGVLKASSGVIYGSATTDDLTEGTTNLFYSNDRVSSYLSSNSINVGGNLTVSGVGNSTFAGGVNVTNGIWMENNKYVATQDWVNTQLASYGNGDITGVTAGDGLTGGGDSGDVTLSLDSSYSPTFAGLTLNGVFSQAAGQESQSMLLHASDFTGDYVISGLLPATSASLTSDISAGKAYVMGRRVVKTITSHSYSASTDTYVDLDSSGVYHFIEVANGATAPSVSANSIRLAKVVTDATSITSVVDLRDTTGDFSITGDLTVSGGQINLINSYISDDDNAAYTKIYPQANTLIIYDGANNQDFRVYSSDGNGKYVGFVGSATGAPTLNVHDPTTDTTLYVQNTDGTYKANLDVENNAIIRGDLTVSGSGTSSFAGGLNVTGLAYMNDSKLIATQDWVDAQLAGSGFGDITSVIAGDGLTGGGDSGDVTLNINDSYVVNQSFFNSYINQALLTTSSPSFAGLTVDTNTLFIDSTNHRVGVGTTSPLRKLHVKESGTAGGIRIESDNSNTYLELYSTVTGVDNWSLRTGTGGFFIKDETAGTDYLNIKNSGNVGIGMIPYYSLDVSGDGRFTKDTSGAGSETDNEILVIKDSNTGGSIIFQDVTGITDRFSPAMNIYPIGTATDESAFYSIVHLDSNSDVANNYAYQFNIRRTDNTPVQNAGILKLYTYDTTNNFQTVFTVDKDGNTNINGDLTVSGTGDSSFAGNVGIGTTSPGALLHLKDSSVDSQPAIKIENDAEAWTLSVNGSMSDDLIIKESNGVESSVWIILN